MSEHHELVADQVGEHLDVFVARKVPELTRSGVRKLIDRGFISIDGDRPKKRGLTLRPGQRVSVALPPEHAALEPETVRLRIVYEDDDLIVVDKPPGMAVHPSPGHEAGTLVHALLGYSPRLSTAGGAERPGIVHRLDKDTSGLIISAKNDRAHAALAKQLHDRTIQKTYVALVTGRIDSPEGTIDAPIARHPAHRQKMAVVEGGRDARTRYRVLRDFSAYSLVELHPETGRTHQLRVHLASIGHPVAGDHVYGGKRDEGFPRQLLHAQRLVFTQPTSGQTIDVEAELPEDLQAAIARLENI